MSEKTQLFIGLRRGNGQIGYLSESLSIPEFFDLIRPTEDKGNVLVDFSPVIEILHSAHEKSTEQSLREKYNSVFNYWQESKSYSNLQIKLPKFESLSMLSNELIVSLQFKIDSYKSQYKRGRNGTPAENLCTIKAIESTANIYIDTMLCFIHSKASLEIESFKRDAVLHQYCEYLRNIISELLTLVVEFSTWNNQFRLNDSSLLYFLAFNTREDVESYTKLLPNFDSSQDLRLSLLKESEPQDSYNNFSEPVKKIEIVYRTPHNCELEMARILRDIAHKVSSLSKLISHLKSGDVEWDQSENTVEELKELILGTDAM
jgi:hypothetical protein